MIIVMNGKASKAQIETVNQRLVELGLKPNLIQGINRIVIGAVGEERPEIKELIAMAGVEKIIPIMKPFKLVSREANETGSTIKVGNALFGSNQFVVIAGPCAVENEDQINTAARRARAAGATILRGGAFKPRTSPYSFQGLEEEGLKYLSKAAHDNNMACVTEVIDLTSLEKSINYVDMLQVGARNMQNFQLLRAVGRSDKPVLLKRGLSATIEEWLMAAEYIMSEGNANIVFCERGIRTFETYTRNTLDLSAVPSIQKLSHLPIIVDPSHATGKHEMIAPMAKAALAAGADGIMVEMHPEPTKALCDGPQSLAPAEFDQLMKELQRLATAMDREIASGNNANA
ncbi:MAG: 3-deoxy-7-phosphoheptulonate synthase [Desulfotomaculum sp.]|nr:3-deoxy-7-phosphoheptulonate synthase [Desulfotomaculum sp.]